MKLPHLHTASLTAQLKSIERQISQDQLQQAALQLNLLARTAPRDPRVFLLGSRLAEAANNPDGILQAARKAHALAPQWPVATIHLAGVLASRYETAEALALAQQAVQQAAEPASQTPLDAELLGKAAAVAYRLNLYPEALQWLRQAEKISPDDPAIRYKIGLALTHSGEPASAVELFSALLQQQPGKSALLSARLQAGLRAQQHEQAIRDAEALLALEPASEEYRFYLEVARGQTPATQPASLITGLFDGYATGFDQHAVLQLHYTLPRDVAQLIHLWHPDRKGDVLDLGCGTGLLGVGLGPIEGVLVGVDLSAAMLEQAARHHVYDSFHQVNLIDALHATPGDHYDVIAALDVLIYVGSLEAVIPDAWRVLLPGGHFVFSCETGAAGAPDYALQASYRYTHQPAYVKRLLEQAGFTDITTQDCVLRHEAQQPVQGFLVTARKPLPAAGKTASKPKKAGKTRRLTADPAAGADK